MPYVDAYAHVGGGAGGLLVALATLRRCGPWHRKLGEQPVAQSDPFEHTVIETTSHQHQNDQPIASTQNRPLSNHSNRRHITYFFKPARQSEAIVINAAATRISLRRSWLSRSWEKIECKSPWVWGIRASSSATLLLLLIAAYYLIRTCPTCVKPRGQLLISKFAS